MTTQNAGDDRQAAVAKLGLRPVIRGAKYEDGGDRRIAVRDPASGELLVDVPDVGAGGVDLAASAAQQASDAWGALSPQERSARLFALATAIEDAADDFAYLEAVDVGKPLSMTPAEVASGIDKLRFFAGACRVVPGLAAGEYRSPLTSFVRREPVGVVAALAPWNYPLALAIWKIAPALAAGNAVVLKPSPETPLTSMLLGQIAATVLPPGVLNVITGGPETGERLVQHAEVDMVSLTGGTATGKAVMRAASQSLKRLHLELGGNAAVLVFDDADFDRLSEAYYMAAFRNSGQDCHAASRVYTTHRNADRVAAVVGEIASTIRVGDNLEPTTTMGPLVSNEQQARVESLVQGALGTGHAELVVGGRRGRNSGYFFEPTVIVGPEHGDEIVQQEVFGPVVSVTSVADEAEAVRCANDTIYGLAASVWTDSMDRALRVTRQLKVGTVWINHHGYTVGEMPFGGRKQSGFGRDLSMYALEQHTDLKHVAIAVRDS